jgi:hypothetical protein
VATNGGSVSGEASASVGDAGCPEHAEARNRSSAPTTKAHKMFLDISVR